MPIYAAAEAERADAPAASDLAYLAGLIDGEGCFQSGQPFKAHGRNMGCVGIQVLMADRDAVDWCAATFGGQAIEHWRTSTGRTVYGWKMQRQADLRWLLPLLIPHLKIKGLQAWAALRVVELLRSQPKYVRPTRDVDRTERAARKGRRVRWRAEVAQAQWGVREARHALMARNPRRERLAA